MSDVHTIEQRHANMAAIRGKDTKPEILVRKYLWRHGFRYRLNHGRLPGKPDIVLRQYRTCIFVNGCFWHGHNLPSVEIKNEELKIKNDGGADVCSEVLVKGITGTVDIESSECCKIPKTNREFWVRKILRNRERDVEVQHRLARMGWHCITVWECELRENKAHQPLMPGEKTLREKTLERLVATLNHIYFLDHNKAKRVIAEPDEEEGLSAMAADDNFD